MKPIKEAIYRVKPGMALWREKIFVFLTRNSQRSSSYFRIDPEQAIEIGLVVEI